MPADLTAQEQQILASFSGRIKPVPISLGYGIALAWVAILMVLLPLIYVGITGGVAWCWWWYAVNGQALFSGGHHGSYSVKGVLLAYLGPLVIGGVLVIFMFKPLFARPPKGAKPLSLEEHGVELVIRVVPDPTKDIGFNIISRFHYQHSPRTVICETIAEAATLLSL